MATMVTEDQRLRPTLYPEGSGGELSAVFHRQGVDSLTAVQRRHTLTHTGCACVSLCLSLISLPPARLIDRSSAAMSNIGVRLYSARTEELGS